MMRRMKKVVLLGLMFAGSLYTYSQVGINTEKPQTTLDVNGDFQLRGEFRAGSSTDNAVAAGTAGQYLMSQGPGLPPTWGEMEIPELNTGDYVLRDTQFAEDRVGVSITAESTGSIIEGTLLNSEWSVIDGLTTTITTTKNKNRVMFTGQTVAQSPSPDIVDGGRNDDYVISVCGIFLGNKGADRSTFKLIGVRQGYVQGGHYPQLAFSILSSYDDLPIGEHEIVIAFQRRGSSTRLSSYPLYIGQGFDTGTGVQVANNFMNKSIIKVDVFEPESEDAGGSIGG